MKKILSLFLVTALFVTMSSSAFAKEETDEVSSNDSHSMITEIEDPSYDWNAMVAGTLPAGGEILNFDPHEGEKIITRIEKPSYDWNAMVAGTLPVGGETFSFDPQKDKVIITRIEKPSYDWNAMVAGTLPAEGEILNLDPHEGEKIITEMEKPLTATDDSISTYYVPCGGADGQHDIQYFRGNIHKAINSETCYYMTTQIQRCTSCSYETETAPTFVSAHPRYDPFCPNYNGGPILD